MSGTPENRVKQYIKKVLARHKNLYTHWPVQTGFGAPTLDCTGSVKVRGMESAGFSFAIEAKAPGKHPTPRQLLTMENMKRGGVTVFIIGESETNDTNFFYRYSGLRELDEWLSAQ